MDWMIVHGVAFGGLLAVFCIGSFIIHRKYCKNCKDDCNIGNSSGYHLNNLIKKEAGIVVDRLDISKIENKDVAICRCWLSNKFPYCDGSHRAHNKETGDNVGPMILTTAS